MGKPLRLIEQLGSFDCAPELEPEPEPEPAVVSSGL